MPFAVMGRLPVHASAAASTENEHGKAWLLHGRFQPIGESQGLRSRLRETGAAQALIQESVADVASSFSRLSAALRPKRLTSTRKRSIFNGAGACL